jgi:hypothetical protein
MRIVKYGNDNVTNLPCTGAGSDIPAGTLLRPGVTAGTDFGALIPVVANTTAGAYAIGILREKHVYATVGDATNAGLKFPRHPVQLIVPGRVCRLYYDPTVLITCTQTVTTTTLTLTSLEDDIDGSFLYVQSGLGAGQTNYLTAAAAGSCTLKAAFGISLDTTSKLIKIVRRFHKLVGLNADGTMLGSYAAVGVHTVTVIDSFIERNGDLVQLDPTKHDALTGLNSLRSIKFAADIMFRNTSPYSID